MTAHDSDASPNPTPARRAALQQLIEQHVERIPVQLEALDRAQKPFSDDAGAFDADRWRAAFHDSDPDTINLTLQLTGGYNGLVNHLVEITKAAVRIAGKEPTTDGGLVGMPAFVETIRLDGGFSGEQARLVVNLAQTRNGLQHDSPSVDADQVFARINQLTGGIRGVLQALLGWLATHGVEVPEAP